ncbi:MAG: class I SAM-dependent methyltransferase [Elusimicrobiota bacterium]|nr:class I SAM-dependent methyltransferase [Elusimicrobiota bacterium]
MKKSSCKHWDAIFSDTEDCELGWYEKNASKTLKLLNSIPKWKRSTVFLPGAGTSVLIEELLSKGVELVLNDISSEALNRVKNRLKDKGSGINWLCQDIARPIPDTLPRADIWIDRAVLHFLTDKEDIAGYFKNVRATLKAGGHAIFAEFSKTGAPKCAGLTLHRYSAGELSKRLGPGFMLISHFDHIFINPYGDPRPYMYALFKKVK